MAERPCDCGVLCLRLKISLCSCRQLLYIRQALHRTSAYVARSPFLGHFQWIFYRERASPTNHCWNQKI